MGRWSHTEYDRILVQKVKALYDSCQDALVEGGETDMRFRTFIKTLNPKDKSVQACFRTLIQQSHYSNAASSSRAQRLRPLSEHLDLLSRPEPPSRPVLDAFGLPWDDNAEVHAYPRGASPPPRTHTRTLRREARAGGAVPAPEVLNFDLPARAGAQRPRHIVNTDWRALSRQRPQPIAGSSLHEASSRTASPSRMRRLGLDPTVQPFSPRPRARTATPPTAASQAWLSEYTTAAVESRPDPSVNILPFPLSYEPYEATYAEARARRRRWDEDEEPDRDGSRVQRRRLSRGPGRDFDAEMEVQAMFGDWGSQDTIPPAVRPDSSSRDSSPSTDDDSTAIYTSGAHVGNTAPSLDIALFDPASPYQPPTSLTSIQQLENTEDDAPQPQPLAAPRRPRLRPSNSYIETMRQIDAAWRIDQELPPAPFDPRRHGIHLSPGHAAELGLPEIGPNPDDVLILDVQEARDRERERSSRAGVPVDEEFWDEQMERVRARTRRSLEMEEEALRLGRIERGEE